MKPTHIVYCMYTYSTRLARFFRNLYTSKKNLLALNVIISEVFRKSFESNWKFITFPGVTIVGSVGVQAS